MLDWMKRHLRLTILIIVALVLIFTSSSFIDLVKGILAFCLTFGLGLVLILATIFAVFYFLRVIFGVKFGWLFHLYEAWETRKMVHRMPKLKKQKRE